MAADPPDPNNLSPDEHAFHFLKMSLKRQTLEKQLQWRCGKVFLKKIQNDYWFQCVLLLLSVRRLLCASSLGNYKGLKACKCFLQPAKSLSILAFWIFPPSSWQNISSSEILFCLLACMACLISLHRFYIIFKSGDHGGHSKTFIHLSWRYFMVYFEVCFGSLSCWNSQPLFNFNVWTDIGLSNVLIFGINSSFHL